MTRSKRPWMPLYVDDYLLDTNSLTLEEHGAYLLLIMEYWRKEGLPEGGSARAMVCGVSVQKWKRLSKRLAPLFQEGWKHKRIEQELEKTTRLSEKRRQA